VAHKVDFDPLAVNDLKRLRAFDRSAIIETIDRILTSAPTRGGKSRIKRLRGIDSPQYRLRVGEFRVFYDVQETNVYILRILSKSDVEEYLKELGL
jgi:mRNA interferase RelE/StbE